MYMCDCMRAMGCVCARPSCDVGSHEPLGQTRSGAEHAFAIIYASVVEHVCALPQKVLRPKTATTTATESSGGSRRANTKKNLKKRHRTPRVCVICAARRWLAGRTKLDSQ